MLSLRLVQYKLALAHYRLSIFTYAKLNFHFYYLQLLVAIATILLLRYLSRRLALPGQSADTLTASLRLCRGARSGSHFLLPLFIKCLAWVSSGFGEGQQKGLGHSPQAFAGLGSGELSYPVVTSALCNLNTFIANRTAYFQPISTRFMIIRNWFCFVKAI